MNSRRLMLAPANYRASYRQKLSHWKGHQRPLWVNSGHFIESCDVCFIPESGLSIAVAGMSAKGQKRKSAGSLIELVGRLTR